MAGRVWIGYKEGMSSKLCAGWIFLMLSMAVCMALEPDPNLPAEARPEVYRNLNPLLKKICTDTPFVLYEGLPNPFPHEKAFQAELEEKGSLLRHGAHFYKEPIQLSEADGKPSLHRSPNQTLSRPLVASRPAEDFTQTSPWSTRSKARNWNCISASAAVK